MPWKLSADGRITSPALERQMNRWDISRGQDHGVMKAAGSGVFDFITLSREVGLDAEGVAEKLGERLGWPFFGKSLLDAMAGDDRLRERMYRSVDERDLHLWEETLRAFLDVDFRLNDYFSQLTRTVLSLLSQSPCVFIGRGCDLMLPRDRGLRIRLVAPVEERVAYLARELEVDPEAARKELDRVERERAEFIRNHFARRADDPTRTDLTLNLGRWSTEVAVDLILAAHTRRAAALATA